MSRRTATISTLAGLAIGGAVAIPATATVSSDGGGSTPAAHQIDLEHLNDSGASGTAMLSVQGTRLTVKIEAQGLVPNAPHAQHLHGSTEGRDFHCPTPDDDKDGDGIVSTPEGVPSYGNVQIALTTDGDTTPDSALAVDRMPTADAEGKLSYERTLEVSQDVADHIKDLHIVQHGIDVNGDGAYDAGAGPSPLNEELPLEATAPAACGLVQGAAIGTMPEGGVETGGGTENGPASALAADGLVAAGGAGLVAAGGALLVAWCRAPRRDH